MGDSLNLEIRNTRDAILPASQRAEAWLEPYNPSPQAMNFALLAIEEHVQNCIDYAYDDSAEHTIRIEMSVADETLTMVVIDDGHPFDPLTAPAPDLGLDIQDRREGGLGLHLLRSLADSIAYERREETNRLTLAKRLR